MSFELYANNLDCDDKNGVKDINVDTSVIFKGEIKLITKEHGTQIKQVPPLAAAVLGLNNTQAPPAEKIFYNTWTNTDVQELYLKTKPTCYLILGKPGAGAYTLGEALSKKLNCIHLCPKNIIQDEMDQKSPTGNCLDFNMKHNKVCDYSTILQLLKLKVQSPTVQHRGYVISGLPLVTSSRKPHYFMKTLQSEEALMIMDELLFDIICNIKKKKLKPPKQKTDSRHTSETSDLLTEEAGEEEQEEEQLPEEEAEEEEPPVELPKFILDSCSDVIHSHKIYCKTKKATILHQIQTIFNLAPSPDIIIYITCPDIDLVTKKNHKSFNYKSSQYTIDPLITKQYTDLRWPSLYTTSDYIDPYDIHVFNPKYHCRLPINFAKSSTEQMCNYKNNLHSYLEKKIQDFNPKLVIKLDGRTSVYQMMHHISERIILMNIHPVLIPEPLYMEDPPEDMDEFWKNIEDIKIIHNDNVNFKRFMSPWFNRCPVELKNRRSVKGNPKYAVMFFRHVYLISSLKAMVMFCRNPRPYLKLQYLEPTSRIIVIGTKSSGKTMVSSCVSWLFDAPIICYKKFLETEKQRKYETFAKSILSEIIATIEDERFMIWQRKELERVDYLNAWGELTLKNLGDYVVLLREFNAKKEKPSTDKPTVTEEESVEEGEEDTELLQELSDLKKELLFLPIVEDLEECEKILAQRDVSSFAPNDLKTVTDKPKIPVIGDEDVSKAISAYILANDLQKELEPTVDELMSEIIKIILNLDEQRQEASNGEHIYGKYVIDGFPSDPEYWRYLSDAKLMPDYTISLIENRELEPDLIDYYTNIDSHIKNHTERFVSAKDPLIQIKLQVKRPSDPTFLNMQMIINDSLNKLLESSNNIKEEKMEEPAAEFISSFAESIEKFKEDWDSVKLNIEECAKTYIEVELENKSDVQIIEEVLLKLRKGYFLTAEVNEEGEADDDINEGDPPKDLLNHNDAELLCETNIYCPITYYDHGVLWRGKPEFSLKYNNCVHYFCKEEYIEIFQKDITKYQSYNKTFKSLPSLKICVIGGSGSGKTTISKLIAKELGLIHIDFAEVINDYLMPKHYKKVGRRYENTFTDESIDEEGVVDFQMDEENENLISDILSNETEIRRMVYNYLERGSPIISILMQKLIKKLWFEPPFVNTGFVIDGFPRLPTDVEDMIACSCIPDLVMELQCSSEVAVNRLSPILIKIWKNQLNKAREVAKLKLENDSKEWMDFITKNVIVKLVCNEILDNMPLTDEEAVIGFSNESVIIDAHPTGSANLDPNLFKIYNEYVEEYPAPQDTSVWEKSDEVRERFDSRTEAIYETDDENIQALKELLSEQRIKVISVDATKPLNNVLRVALLKLASIRNRCESFFEQTFIVKPEIAEMLLTEGFCFLSKFARLCPVYVYENPKTIFDFYKVGKRKGSIFPIVHRAHIYFINGVDSVTKFRTNPLIYIVSKAIKSHVEYPLRIGIIGPPKSGKSSLAAKIAKQYELICISRGKAIRNILENMPWTELGSLMAKALYEGECIKSDHIVRAVQTLAIDHRTFTQGFVLDGFPYTPSEAMELAHDGLYPSILLDIAADKDTILYNSQHEIYYDMLKLKPPYSCPLLEYRFKKWCDSSYKIRDWIMNDYQNLYVIHGNGSKWQCLQDAKDRIYKIVEKMHYYLSNVKVTIVPAKAMCISNDIFNQKISPFKNMCPLCLRQNVIKHSGYPVDKTGVVQFRNKYYWICSDHMTAVLNHPHTHLSNQKISIPEIPVFVKTVNVDLVHENGVCIVSYAENLPAQIIERGTNKFAVSFKGKTYLLCSEKCMSKFLSKPHLYADIVVFKETKLFPPLTLKTLPDLGYLEQIFGNILTEACCSVNIVRPKYPGLSLQTSALIYLALYLKTHNPLAVNKIKQEKYVKALKIYEARSKLLINVGLRLRSMDNPLAKYPKCLHKIRKIERSVGSLDDYIKFVDMPSTRNSIKSLSARRVPVPDERYDYLCEYHKPASKVPAFLNVVDIAGLVRGAAEGQGLGNAFLSHIKACDAIFNLCRAFDDEDVIHVDGDVNPVRDLETIGEELRLKDEEQLMQNIEKLDRVVNRGNDKKLKPEYDTLMKIKSVLVDEKKHIRFGDWSAADIEILNKYLFLTSKPALYLVNLSEKDYTRKKNKWLPKLKEWIDKNDPGAPLIPFSGVLETKLLDMEPSERQAYLKENNLTSALDKIIVQGYKALQLEYFFTAGADEVKAWTIQKGTKAPQAAGRIHTDFEKGFIMAEVMHFKDFKEEGTEAACKAAGKYRQQGRNYVVEDGDIIFFKFNAGAGLKDAKKK